MLNQLLNKKVIYAVYHTKEIRTGWCMSVEKIYPDGRAWPHIIDDENKITFAVFGPVTPYNKDTIEAVAKINKENQDLNERFVKCWDLLYSVDYNREGS